MIRRTLVLIVIAALCAGCSGRSKSKDELLGEGIKLMQENNPGGAIVLFKKALEKDQNFFDARFRLAQAYRYTGKLDGAEKELLKVTKQSPSFREEP